MSDLLLLPVLELVLISAGFGLIIGSFLNVFIYRFRTGKSLSGNSHCLSCATPLKWFELFPVVSYLGLRGRCRTCGCKIPSRYALVESFTAVLFVFSAFQATSLIELLFLWVVMSVLVVVFVYDLNHYIIPDSTVVTLLLLTGGWLGYSYYLGMPLQSVLFDVLAAALGASFFLALWLISRGQWLGFGDVKLALPLGLLVGSAKVFSMIVFSFWIGAAISLTLVGFAKLQRGKLGLLFGTPRLTIKSVVPFAPFLIAGCLLVFFTQLNVINLFSF